MFETAKKEINVDGQITSKRFKGGKYLTNNLLLTLLIFFPRKLFSAPTNFIHTLLVVIVTELV